MNANVTGRLARQDAIVPVSRHLSYIAQNAFDRPTLVIDSQAVARQYAALAQGLGRARIHYAVKANPEPQILRRLTSMGSNFDAASRAEIEMCLAAGAKPKQITFGNTIKRPADIAFAHEIGITHFAVDALAEMEKLAEHAPGARVCIRLLVEATGADWPLSRKFGCTPAMALTLMDRARALGLCVSGLSFHVGSQTRDPQMWADTLDQVAQVWRAAKNAGHELTLLNIGGGFPASYGTEVMAPNRYAQDVMALVNARFPDACEIMAEPGRGLVAEAGAIAAEVLLVSRKDAGDLHRWVYLDIGKFSGLAETMDEAIRYRITTDHGDGQTGPCILAGPSCDSADVLYEKQLYQMPLELKAGDRVVIHACGAYTTTYASVGFNGFPPLDVVVI
ncbi:putative lysine/ornithine decarboxylase [Phaeobacter piscinae]|uniref:ornithine decarboxylase n=2 Tax=Phaeobacter piscinae TaxID=1580596 RepID=A0ABM6PA38_9RHOB|nr:putative lysine/ornithine decarboxylase [Phaeobacter piscinae]AUQ84992.1 putative lysine/ornithine decarboxylase [Phaeobacter piscinae]AUR22876.1 putative lysine/ornithine decarboxylase [Phaeobacter piscinae]